MDVIELKHMIHNRTVPNFLIFTGEEYMVQRIYIQQIAKEKGLKVQYADTVADIQQKIGTISLFDENYLYVVLDDKEFMQNKHADEIISMLQSDMLILTLTTLDKRLKFIKEHNSSLVDFKPLKSENLKVYIKREIALSDRNIHILMEVCGHNYGHCLLEIDKIQKYSHGGDIDVNDAFVHLMEDGAMYIPPRDAIFDFVKAVVQRRRKVAYELLHECKQSDVPTLSIISNLYNLARWTYQVQTCTSKDVEKSTGLSYWQIRNAKECAGGCSIDDLEYLMRLCQNTEKGIKQGKIEEEIAVEYILAKFLFNG